MTSSRIYTSVFIMLATGLLSQHYISNYEYRWAFWHPFAAIKIKKVLPSAMQVYQQIKTEKRLDSLENGGKLDAFRHAFTMAYLAQKIEPKKIHKLGIAHEKGNMSQFFKNQTEDGERIDSIACEMDLRNNTVGILIGSQNKSVSQTELKNMVLTAIDTGKCWYIKRNNHYKYVTCTGELINLGDYKNKWFVPKCLINTNL